MKTLLASILLLASFSSQAATVVIDWGYEGVQPVDGYSLVVDGVEVDSGPYDGPSQFTLIDQTAGDYTATISVCNAVGCVETSLAYEVPVELDPSDLILIITVVKS